MRNEPSYSDRLRDGVAELKGKTLSEIDGMEPGSERVTFVCNDGSRYLMWHSQDCCETVALAEVVGDPKDLIGAPIVEAESAESERADPAPHYPESWTWTFYKLGTAKGFVTLRWLGESNGYYSERVDFARWPKP